MTFDSNDLNEYERLVDLITKRMEQQQTNFINNLDKKLEKIQFQSVLIGAGTSAFVVILMHFLFRW